ncbi:Aminoacyl-transfer RNA synthetases class-II family profile [Nakaseomyces glabratus]
MSAEQAPAHPQQNAKKEKKSKLQVSLKTPKGTKDWADTDMVIREAIFSNCSRSMVVLPLTHLCLSCAKSSQVSGEDSKLIYDLKDQGGELCSLTVPFARFVAMNNIQNIKRYHIAKVYRRDQPAMTKGRMREFYQCDFDIAGSYESMVPDAEILSILVEGLTGLGINDFKVKLNHRKILDGIFQISGVKDEDVRKISSAVDKLDKSPWEVVRKEITVEKGQSLIYEAVTEASAPPENATELKKKSKSTDDASEYVGVGSIAAGGRYDNLVNMFAEASGKKSSSIPCVGVSFGVERIFSLIKQRTHLTNAIKPTATQVFVMAFGGGKDWTGLLPERMAITKKLWEAGIEAEYVYKSKANPRKQFDAADKAGCPIAVILGKEEFAEGKVRVKRLGQEFANDDGELVDSGDVIEAVKQKLSEVHKDGINDVTRLLKGL